MAQYLEYSGKHMPHWVSEGKKTVDEIIEAEKSVEYTPHSIERINGFAQSAGWKGAPIPDKFTPEQKIERADRYNRLHEKLLRIAADRHFKKEQATNIFVDWQKNAGVKDIKTSTRTRYADYDIFDFSGTEEAAQKNAEMMQTFSAAQDMGEALEREKAAKMKEAQKNGQPFDSENYQDRAKTEEEKAVEEKFNGYHQKWIDKIKSYDLDKHLENLKNDEYLVEHAEELIGISSFKSQIQNIRSTYQKAHIAIPQEMNKELENLSEKLSIAVEFTDRIDMIDSPYYAELDMDDVATQRLLASSAVRGEYDLVKDHKHPLVNEIGYSKLSSYSNVQDALSGGYVREELQAVRSLAERAGIPAERLMLKLGEDEPRQLFKNGGKVNSFRRDEDQRVYTHEIQKVTFYDRDNPEHKLEWPSGTENNHPFVRALAEMNKPAPEPVPKPVEPKQPKLWKRILNVFGLFKQEINDYNQKLDEYKTNMDAHEAYQKRADIRKIATDFGVKEPQVQQEQPKQKKKQTEEKTLAEGFKRFDVEQTKMDMKFDKVDPNYSKRPDLTDGVRSWQRSANRSLARSGGQGRAGAIGYMGKSVFDKVSKQLDEAISSNEIKAHDPKINKDKELPDISKKLGEMKLSDFDIHAMGMYQMFCDENGVMREDGAYGIIQKDPAGGPVSLKNFSNFLKENFTDNAKGMTYAALVEKMRNKEPIIPKETQEKLLNGYKEKLDPAQKTNEKAVKEPQNKVGQQDKKIENPVKKIEQPVKKPVEPVMNKN